MASLVAGSFTHEYPATSGTGYALGAAAQVGDVIVLFASYADALSNPASATCTGAVASFNQQAFINVGVNTCITALTALVTGAGTPTVAVTQGVSGSDLGWSAVIVRGLSSATANTTNTAGAGSGTTLVASVNTSVQCSLFVSYANEQLNNFTSWLLSATQLNLDTGHIDGNAYLLGQAAGTYGMGINRGVIPQFDAVVTIALPETVASVSMPAPFMRSEVH